MKNTDPLMGEKLKSKTHLQNTFLIFLAVFRAFGFKVFKKCSFDPKKISWKIKKDIKKRRLSRWFRISWKSFNKCTQKVLSKTSLMNMCKSENSAYFRHVFANNFFFVTVFKNFFKVLNFLIKIFFCSFAHKTAQKPENLFYDCVLEFY